MKTFSIWIKWIQSHNFHSLVLIFLKLSPESVSWQRCSLEQFTLNKCCIHCRKNKFHFHNCRTFSLQTVAWEQEYSINLYASLNTWVSSSKYFWLFSHKHPALPMFMLSSACRTMTTAPSCDVPFSSAKKATASHQKTLVLWDHLGI